MAERELDCSCGHVNIIDTNDTVGMCITCKKGWWVDPKTNTIMWGEDPEDEMNDPFQGIISDLHALLLAKHNDYGTTNLDEFGVRGIVIRVSDKRNRIINMLKTGKDGGVVGEKEEQEWIDIAGYAIQAIRMIREGKHDGTTKL